ncbi:MazG-like pyrophosphatase [Salmonella phage barely]|uniref:Nucleoside triphosphate pyrophosphohydrolase n=1 Tax=Salmonella phage barely TaxID=2713278 RepID=A0A6G8RP83_9CAUD|nr:MazG-like pyrophosphatase [Salmonella phage barely]QIO03055.1 nucleoside triphosphate pyrophosphohydrolase [Salmonella phage barely]
MTTTFNKNVRLNLAFGNAAGDITAPDFGKIRNQAKLVLEETRELLEAAYFDHEVKIEFTASPRVLKEPAVVDIKDIMRQILDAQGDITTVNDGVAHIAGFNGDECLQRVFASNMSKFIRSEDEVGPALEYYYSRGFPDGQLRVEGEFPQACIKVNETVMWNGKEYPKGKFLKNMAVFKEPDFSDMLTNTPSRQINDIVVSMAIEEGQVFVDDLNGVALVSPKTLEVILSMAVEKSSRPVDVNGQIESYVPAYIINDTNMPKLCGVWGANVRVYACAPVQNTVTHLSRFD